MPKVYFLTLFFFSKLAWNCPSANKIRSVFLHYKMTVLKIYVLKTTNSNSHTSKVAFFLFAFVWKPISLSLLIKHLVCEFSGATGVSVTLIYELFQIYKTEFCIKLLIGVWISARCRSISFEMWGRHWRIFRLAKNQSAVVLVLTNEIPSEI